MRPRRLLEDESSRDHKAMEAVGNKSITEAQVGMVTGIIGLQRHGSSGNQISTRSDYHKVSYQSHEV